MKQENIERMKVLDDQTVAKNDDGITQTRDVVHYVELSKYIPDGKLDPLTFQTVMDAANAKYYLAKDVLAEVPSQVVEYMDRNGFRPGVPDVQTALRMQQMRL